MLNDTASLSDALCFPSAQGQAGYEIKNRLVKVPCNIEPDTDED